MRLMMFALTALLCCGSATLRADEKKAEQPKMAKVEKRKGPLAIGDAAPMTDVKMENVDGKQITLADVKGKKGTLVIFSCNHCPVAKAYETRIAAIGNEWKKKDIGVVVINSNDPNTAKEDGLEQMKELAKDREFEFPYVVDSTSEMARAFGASKTPEVFLFDADSKLAYYGRIDDTQDDAEHVATPDLKNALTELHAGKPITVATTKAFGCGIKFRAERKAEEKEKTRGT